MNGPPPKFFTIKASKIEIAGGLIKRENLNPVEERKRMPTDQMAISTPITARRDADGVLWVELYKCIGNGATEAERFPDWEDSP